MEVIVQIRPLRKATHLSSRNVFIILTVMMLFVLWLALTTVPLSHYRQLSENLELFVIGNQGTTWTAESFSFLISVLTLQMGIILFVRCITDIDGGILAPP
jgi:hypothetical protein